MTSSVNFSGLASGLDTASIVTGLVNAESIPLNAVKTEQTTVTQIQSTITDFSSKVSALGAAAQALADPVQFNSLKATSSDSGIVATVSNGAATAGAYDITVTSLAHEQRTYSDSQTSSTDALSKSGTLTLKAGAGAAVDVAIDATDSLTDIASKITASGARVTASVLFDGTNYKLQIRGRDTGATNAVAMTESGFSLGLNVVANQYQKATDAELTVDGVKVTRSSNQIVGVIPGVTLALTKPTTGAASVSIDTDSTSLSTKISSFVSAYNNVISAGHFAAGYGTIKASIPELAGDSAVRTTLDRLSRIMGASVPGATGKYTNLMSVGLSLDKTGALQFDATKLSDALTTDPTGVSRLFVDDPATSSTGAMGTFNSAVTMLATGPQSVLTTKLDALTTRASGLTDRAASLQRYLDGYQTSLKQQFANMESLMSQFKSSSNVLAGLPGGAA